MYWCRICSKNGFSNYLVKGRKYKGRKKGLVFNELFLFRRGIGGFIVLKCFVGYGIINGYI